MNANLLLVIDHRETQVTLDGHALRVVHPDTNTRHIPLGLLGLVVVYGRALVGCDVWRALAERQIPAVLQPARGQGACAWMGAALGPGVALRTAQHRAADRAELRLSIARGLVAAKITAQAQAAKRLIVPAGAAAMRQALLKSQREALAQIGQAPSSAALMGIEGAVAAAWFHWLTAVLPPVWGFKGRNRRPPRDPVNALLSLGYTLLGGDMLGAVQQQGLDPARGLFHGLVPGRESLVLDLIEPLRPAVDVVVLGLLDGTLTPADFTTTQEDGCRLTKEARGKFYEAWALARQDWPNLLPLDHAAVTTAGQSQPIGLPQWCRQRIDWLRQGLTPVMPMLEDAGSGVGTSLPADW